MFGCSGAAIALRVADRLNPMARQTILMDAEDTLWEDNVLYEGTIRAFLAQLDHLGYTQDYIRHILNETEKRNIQQHGYGVRMFRRSLEETYEKLAGNSAQPEVYREIERFVAQLEAAPPQILDGVPETLAYLARRHRLILLTRGEAAQQAAKLERSGLQSYFDAVEIVSEKGIATIERVVGQFKIVKSNGWTVGNSPAEDVIPALQAGLNAVLIPHPATWDSEKADIECGAGKLILLAAFRRLRDYF